MKAKSPKERYGKIVQMIAGRMAVLNMYADDLAQKALSRDGGALHRRLEDPGRMPLGDYLKICRELGLPIEEVRAALEYKSIGG